jgi:Tol biopolymer transport system component
MSLSFCSKIFVLLAFALTAIAQTYAFINNISQLTFEGNRSGEGYFSSSGEKICFQSEAFVGNPFYQIYQLDLLDGSSEMISSGVGKTTCAWFHPNKDLVLYASTHHDPDSLDKQKEELNNRREGKKKKYSWDYDKQYELYTKNLTTGLEKRLTHELGYDAECAFSPDGKKIVFTSNRHAFTNSEKIQTANISIHNEIYMMDYESGGVDRLTDQLGYDGGPFFNSTGNQICWRRFSADGHNAEIFVMSLSTKTEKQITHLGAMSWAPFFHPSNEYIIFSTNLHGFQNFELYLVDSRGEKEPVRVTEREGFDSLPTFSPDGKTISWTSNATPTKKSQIFIADWDHKSALQALQNAAPINEVHLDSQTFESEFSKKSKNRVKEHLTYLSSNSLGGRYTGSDGMMKANKFVADTFASYDLEQVSSKGWHQDFPFFKSATIADSSFFKDSLPSKTYNLGKDWNPLAFSESGESQIDQLIFAGYGLRLPEKSNFKGYDSYTHLDVKDKWVLCLRKLPTKWVQETKDQFYYHSTLRKKASVARDLGARGIIFISDNNESDGLVIPFNQSTREKISIQALSISYELAAKIFSENSRDLVQVLKTMESGNMSMGYTLETKGFKSKIKILRNKGTCKNTIGYLDGNKNGKLDYPYILVGAHLDHVGFGESSSRAGKKDKGKIHPGADDNGSGVSALLEIIRLLLNDPKNSPKVKVDVVFATWSGEEIGLVGSSYFANQLNFTKKTSDRPIIAYLNMDMIGRLRDKMTIHGVGSSSSWRKIIQKANVPLRINLNLQNDSHIPTDTTSFYSKGIPILSAFTGLHDDYHSPSDTADKINYDGINKCAKLYTRIITTLSDYGTIDYLSQQAPASKSRTKLRAYLGTIPNYSQTDQKGVLLSGVTQKGPADIAGLESGDLVIELSNFKIENIYDYTEAIGKIKAGKKETIKVLRNGNIETLTIIPKAR